MKVFLRSSQQPQMLITKNSWKNGILEGALLVSAVGFMSIISGKLALAEGTAQWGLNQPMAQYGTLSNLNPAQTRITSASRALYVDIFSAGEVINISACGNSDSASVGIEIYQTFTNTIDPAFIPTTGSSVLTQTLATGNVSCSNPMTGTLTTPLQFVTPSAGTYEIRLTTPSQYFNRVDVTVTPNTATPVNPSQAGGRLYAYAYGFNAGDYGLAQSTNADFFVKVPGGRPGENFVWKLDLNQFAGFVYDIVGNSYGVNPPRSGFSVPQSGNNVTPEYPIYLSPPAQVGPRPILPPGLVDLSFVDNQGVDNSISPGGTIGIQDSGTFTFTTDIIGNYSVQIDVNQDGIYSPVNAQGNDSGDVFINGLTNGPSTISVPWNGRTNAGILLPNGTYNARVQMRAGEYHFVAGDAETSGGGVNNGLTVFESLGAGVADTLVFWDDATFLTGTTTLPNGVLSSTPQARHTWGNFTGTGFGNATYIDTYVYGSVTTVTTPVIIGTTDVPPGIGLSGKVWNDANGSANNTFANINNGTEIGTNAGGLQAILINSTGNVIATTPIAADGTYTFTSITTNQNNVTLRLSPTAGTVGQTAPTAAVPTGWIGTSPLTTAAFNIGTTNITNQDFGIRTINPDLAANYCQASRDFLFILDDSSSVDATEIQQQRDAVMAMLNHIVNNGLSIRAAIVGFDATNRTVINYTDVTAANLATFQTALNTNYGVPGSGTNWEAGFQQGATLGLTPGNPDVTFFFTDGFSNAGGSPIDEANQFKLAGSHIYGIWIDSDPALTVESFKEITDGIETIEFSGTNASIADYIKVTNYGELPPKMASLIQGVCPGKPNLLLVKRITQVNDATVTLNGDNLATYINEPGNAYDDNTLDNPVTPARPDTDKWPTPNTFLIGGVNGGNVRPSDELEYTIYFLSAGDSDANNVFFCDRVPSNVTFVPTAFNGQPTAPGGLGTGDRGIFFGQGTTTGSLSNISDGDIAQYLAPGISIGSVYPSLGNSCGTNDNGAIVVNLGTIPKADAPGTPANSYGFIRFRGRVK
jgi:uncharacterized repeat protein (TIGR01451 family)